MRSRRRQTRSSADYTRYTIGMIGAIRLGHCSSPWAAHASPRRSPSDWVSSLTSAARRIADGDLGVVIARDNNSQIGDIQESMGKMVASFRATITRIERAAAELTDSATAMAETSDSSGRAIGEVAQSISSISEGAAHQVALITEASGVVAQIETAVVETARNATAAQQESAQTERLTDAGVDRATEIQAAMETVREATQLDGRDGAARLSETSANIDEIVHSITSISGQTNLLALNAAIEAARAGEQGRGFAVVAEEVRKLAEDSQSSAEGIADLIDSIQAQTVQAVAAMEEGTATVDRGFEAVNRNRQLFFDISGAVRMFHESSMEIAGLAQLDRRRRRSCARAHRGGRIGRRGVERIDRRGVRFDRGDVGLFRAVDRRCAARFADGSLAERTCWSLQRSE